MCLISARNELVGKNNQLRLVYLKQLMERGGNEHGELTISYR
jgi:hypothetical protein